MRPGKIPSDREASRLAALHRLKLLTCMQAAWFASPLPFGFDRHLALAHQPHGGFTLLASAASVAALSIMPAKPSKKSGSTKRRKVNTALDQRFVNRHQRAPLKENDHSEASTVDKPHRGQC